ncbi:MAG: aldehyde dehydrogenase EutE [candidate division KSB1 bacterium]|nr:aldehyde dehydrogenase EutE [candidate division KSB1 bacterium]MDZ7336363.1 aldehyde dehydrogenase EutE [candidate division KSB1 bacterium]MDZ7356657.1 aldehyde dehydrogenase EutE [candidate division KSB1 bacterium]MDZ7398534.1 aldehyde dehydrogenase EutE [candidate division KSB1 bacterium]
MSFLGENQIETIAQKIVEIIIGKSSVPDAGIRSSSVFRSGWLGIFPTIDEAVTATSIAQRQLTSMTLRKRDEIIASIRAMMLEHARELAEFAVAETGLGRVEDKIAKNKLVSEKTPGTEDLYPIARSGDHGLSLFEPAPYGVIGAITPITNPTSTIICNTIGMVAAGNGVVFNVHPGAKNTSIQNIHLINQAIIQAGGPVNLVSGITEPTIATAQQLMRHPGIRILVITGGGAVVREAMNSGKRAICAGPGNPPVVVDETADLERAGEFIVKGASFDNNIICVDEKELIVVEAVADQLLRIMQNKGAILLKPQLLPQLEQLLFEKTNGPAKPGMINKSLIGKNANLILSKLGLSVDDRIRLAVIEVDRTHPLVWTEQMMPILPMVRVANADEAIDLAKQVEGGNYHTAVMYSRNLDNLSRMAREINTTIFVKNGPAYAGLGFGGEGYTSFSIASPTGEGLTGPRSFSRERRCVLVDHFRIV